jgi:chromosome segregation ATPase
MVQETPHSLFVTLRKRFGAPPKSSQSQIKSTKQEESSDIAAYVEQVEAKLKIEEHQLSRAKDTIKLLESKLAVAEADLIKQCNTFNSRRKKTDDEIKLLKQSVKASSDKETETRKVLSETKKIVKTKDKEIYNLQGRVDNFLDSHKTMKDKISQLTKDIKNCEKVLKTTEKKALVDNEKL